MISSPFEMPAYDDGNPLDMVEDIANAKGWTFVRKDEDMLVLTVPGNKTTYEAWLEWQDEFSAVVFSCVLPVQIKEAQHEAALRTTEQINQNLWLGHFDLSTKGGMPTYRHTLLLRMVPASVSGDMIEDLLDIAQAECDRFHTTYQLVQAGDVTLHDNLSAAIFETVGEA